MIDDEKELPKPGHPLNALATRLGELLDEDHWAECESLLLKACADTKRLDFLDGNLRMKMGWNVGAAPAGNLSVSSVIQPSGPTSIRAAIDTAMAKTHNAELRPPAKAVGWNEKLDGWLGKKEGEKRMTYVDHTTFLLQVQNYVEKHPEVGAYISDFVARGIEARIAELQEKLSKTVLNALAVDGENWELTSRCERFREALDKIASCESKFPGDVVDIARKALSSNLTQSLVKHDAGPDFGTKDSWDGL